MPWCVPAGRKSRQSQHRLEPWSSHAVFSCKQRHYTKLAQVGAMAHSCSAFLQAYAMTEPAQAGALKQPCRVSALLQADYDRASTGWNLEQPCSALLQAGNCAALAEPGQVGDMKQPRSALLQTEALRRSATEPAHTVTDWSHGAAMP